jgi:uncharacterized protein YehS (DUF1456 family)
MPFPLTFAANCILIKQAINFCFVKATDIFGVYTDGSVSLSKAEIGALYATLP